MASIKAILRINENGNGVIESVTTNVETNNISAIPYTTNVTSWFLNQTSQNQTYQGATVNVLGSGAKYGSAKYGVKKTSDNSYTNSYLGLMFPTPSQLQNDFTITIVGTDVLSFNIHFDNSMGQYPTNYTIYSSISGTTTSYTSSDNVIEVNNLMAGHGTTIITFTSWNLQNVPIGITYFENVEIDIVMDKSWIDEFETQSQKTSDGESVQYGILANTGSITLRDKDKSLLEKSKMGYLGVYLFTLELYVNNRLLQTHISTSAPYFTDNYTMKFELGNKIEKFKDVYLYDYGWGTGYTPYEIIEEILSFVDSNIDVVYKDIMYWNGGDVEENLYEYLDYYKVPQDSSIHIDSDNVLNLLDKICKAFGLNAYFSDNDKLVLSMARPRKLSTEVVINIPYQKQFSDFDYSILTSNRYDRVFFDDENVSGNYKNSITLATNEFFGFDVSTPGFSITQKDILRNQVLEDYADGIKIAKISVFPSDLYTTSNVRAKNWKNGEILEIDDIVRIENKDGNNVLYDKNYQEVYWRVIDRKVRYEGQILIDLVLQEIKN